MGSRGISYLRWLIPPHKTKPCSDSMSSIINGWCQLQRTQLEPNNDSIMINCLHYAWGDMYHKFRKSLMLPSPVIERTHTKIMVWYTGKGSSSGHWIYSNGNHGLINKNEGAWINNSGRLFTPGGITRTQIIGSCTSTGHYMQQVLADSVYVCHWICATARQSHAYDIPVQIWI